jgi:hypothetical protein
MRHAAWFLLSLLGALAFGQTAPGNSTAAAGANEQLKSLRLLAPPKLFPDIKLLANASSSVCSIPLLNVKPRSTNDRMPIKNPPVTPYEKSRELKLQVAAPACDEKLFQNK